MDTIMTEKGLEACGWLCGAVGIIGAALLEWVMPIPNVSPLSVGIGGAVAATGFFGLSVAFRGE